MQSLTIATRFRGPPESSNGGYFAGLVATRAARTVSVRLLKPPPLNVGLEVTALDDGGLRVLRGEEPIGEAYPAVLTLAAPRAPDYLEAVEASRHYVGFRHHLFPSCFVCGTQRTRGDGLRIFAGPIPERGLVAAPWVPDASLDAGDGKVRAEFMSAALDCPGYFAVTPDDRTMLLGDGTGENPQAIAAHALRAAHEAAREGVVAEARVAA